MYAPNSSDRSAEHPRPLLRYRRDFQRKVRLDRELKVTLLIGGKGRDDEGVSRS